MAVSEDDKVEPRATGGVVVKPPRLGWFERLRVARILRRCAPNKKAEHISFVPCDSRHSEESELTGLSQHVIDAIFHQLSTYPNLTSLELRWCKTLENLDGLAGLRSLRSLNCIGCRSLANVDGLANLSNLSMLNLGGCPLENVDALANLPSLSILDLQGADYVYGGIHFEYDALKNVAGLSNLPSLTTLDLSSCRNLENVDGLSNLPSLTTLDLGRCYELKNVDGLRNLPNLTTLDLSRCYRLENVDGLSNLPSLSTLDLRECDALKNVDGLRNLPNLTTLVLSYCKSLENVDGLLHLASVGGGHADAAGANLDSGNERQQAKAKAEEYRNRIEELDEMAFEERCRRLRLIRLAFACLFACLLAAILYGVLRPRYVDATVTAVSWTHTVKVLRYQVVTGSGFFKPPGAFDVEAQGRRHSHYKQVQTGTKRVSYEEKYACGTARVCKPSPRVCRRTPVTCKPNKNGFKTCTGGEERCSSGGQTCTQGETKTCSRTQYKTVPTYKKVSVIRMWYSWKVWAWRPNREVVAKGTSEPPRWPSAAKVGLNQKLSAKGQKERAERVAHYMVVLTDAKNRQHTFEFKDVKRFNALPLGQRRQLKLGVGRKTKVLPAN